MTTRQTYEWDEVYQGLTRPPMMFGVTEVYIVIVMVLEIIIFVGIGKGLGLSLAAGMLPVFWLFGVAMCRRDPRTFEIWLARLRHFSVARRRAAYWHGASFDPY